MNIEKTRINIIDCAKTYPDGTRGLQPVSLTIEPGEVIALLGPSGCGKTTLLRLLAGLETADPGSRIVFADQDVTHLSVEKRGIGMVFQSYALFPQMTVQANIAYGLKVRGVSAQEQRQTIAELVDLVRLNGLEKKRPAELSGGQRQRVALARAVAVKPRVLLLDEPLAALDAKLKETLRDELAQLLRRLGITTVHVTHDQHEALAIADRLAIMSAGQIMQVGDGESLYRKPAHPFVAQFLGRVNRVERDDRAITSGIISFGDTALMCPEHLKSHPAVLLRPEDIRIGAVVQGHPQATIERRVFLGDRVQLQLRLSNRQILMAEQPGDTLFREGEVIGLNIDTARFLPAYDN
ncbi:putative spermidine/putrescine transport system ATP-binding protein [Advenella incenata]|jgi:putative spermidine/putrescine transport system ATP-binding protein|uniref:Putative spermidine/putrescine transport system ATP-binding protein n=1 Tax=Advenella incenata TaxID=267800 RepID=A0A4Q7VEL7_9BURK|nr:ABC transporter ATP-binding protein [Advenella incenata]RZT94450.1 putative spermidine/putrescine transport system ATP-binding protein [Advenella incenata]